MLQTHDTSTAICQQRPVTYTAPVMNAALLDRAIATIDALLAIARDVPPFTSYSRIQQVVRERMGGQALSSLSVTQQRRVAALVSLRSGMTAMEKQ